MYKFILLFFTCCQGAKILGVFPFPSQSHHVLGSALLKELAARGHQVTMISPYPLKNPPKNYTDIPLERVNDWKDKNCKEVFDPNSTVLKKVYLFYSRLYGLSKLVLEEEHVAAFLKSGEKFDVAINMMGYCESILAIGRAVNASNIGFGITGGTPIINYHSAIPTPYAYVSNKFYFYTDKMTFFQRLMNTLFTIGFDLLIHFIYLPNEREVVKEKFPKGPSLDDLLDDLDLYLINSHPVLEGPRPYLPNTIQIGGFHLVGKETLPEDLKTFMDKSKNGVILFSLGTNLKSSELVADTLDGMLKAFKKSKFDFLVKFDNDVPNKLKNVKISNWLPQKAILEHPKTKAFITHGGLGSIAESVYNAVPMICIPFFGDQHKNVEDAVLHGYGIKLDIKTITEEILSNAIKEITENPKYLLNVRLRADAFRNQEMDPMDKAVFWVEHVVKHKGAKHLKSMASQLKWYQYLLLDVFAFIGAILLTVLAITVFITKKMLSICFGKKSIQAKQKSNRKVKKQ